MTSTFPYTKDIFVDPTPTSRENIVSHSSQHIKANDAIAAMQAVAPYVDLENKDVVTIKAGQAVAIHSSGIGSVLATAVGVASPCVGLAIIDVAPTFSGATQTDGILELDDWTDAAGSVELSRGLYFLDTTSGMITQTAPVVSGQIVQPIGNGVSPTKLDIFPQSFVLI